MKGFVPTPDAIVDLMVGKLFAERPPTERSRVLDPGCGNGEFIAGVLRICTGRGWPIPAIVGVELDPGRATTARDRFCGVEQVRPKLLVKDITVTPFFVMDRDGTIVPRHSVYYVVPTNPNDLEPLAEYLNSPAIGAWLRAHCQRAPGDSCASRAMSSSVFRFRHPLLWCLRSARTQNTNCSQREYSY